MMMWCAAAGAQFVRSFSSSWSAETVRSVPLAAMARGVPSMHPRKACRHHSLDTRSAIMTLFIVNLKLLIS